MVSLPAPDKEDLASVPTRRRAPPGLGPKGLFFDAILPHFCAQSNLERLSSVLIGAACEQWINCECSIAIRQARPSLWVHTEWKKRDLALFATETDTVPALIIETKVLYSNYSSGKQLEKLRKLAGQLQHCGSLGGASGSPPAAYGLVVSIDYEASTADGQVWRPKASLPARERLPKALLVQAGLENAFGHGGGRVLRGRATTPSGHTRVSVRMELVRTAVAAELQA